MKLDQYNKYLISSYSAEYVPIGFQISWVNDQQTKTALVHQPFANVH